MPLPFEQQPKEGNKAFAAFSLYLSLGPARTAEAVAVKCQRSVSLIRRWCTRHDWTDRVAAYNAHLAEIERETIQALAREKAVAWHTLHEEQRRAEWRSRCRLIELAEGFIQRWEGLPQQRVPGLESIVSALRLAHELGRNATGMPRETVAVTGDDGGPIRVEFDVALRKIYGAAAGAVVEAEVVEDKGQRPEVKGQEKTPTPAQLTDTP